MTASILIVEDEPVVALDMETALRQAGFTIAGLAGSCERAMGMLNRHGCDAAVLDANLRGEGVEMLAMALQERDTRYLLVSGYGRTHLPPALFEAPFLSKPFEHEDLVRAVRALLADGLPGTREKFV